MERTKLRPALTVRVTPQALYYDVELLQGDTRIAFTTSNPNDADAELAGRQLKAAHLNLNLEDVK